MAHNYKESEMIYRDYSKAHFGDDNPKQVGSPDDKELNRKELYEVLPFINELSTASNWESASPCQHAEKLIHDFLPDSIRSRSKVWQWLVDNWTKY